MNTINEILKDTSLVGQILLTGQAKLKEGRKTTAVVTDRAIFYPLNNIKSSFQFQYSVKLSFGLFECENLSEVETILNKYIN